MTAWEALLPVLAFCGALFLTVRQYASESKDEAQP